MIRFYFLIIKCEHTEAHIKKRETIIPIRNFQIKIPYKVNNEAHNKQKA